MGTMTVAVAEKRQLGDGNIQLLEPAAFEKFVNSLTHVEQTRAKIKTRGWVRTDCDCTVFHTIDLVPIPLYGPDGQIIEKELLRK